MEMFLIVLVIYLWLTGMIAWCDEILYDEDLTEYAMIILWPFVVALLLGIYLVAYAQILIDKIKKGEQDV